MDLQEVYSIYTLYWREDTLQLQMSPLSFQLFRYLMLHDWVISPHCSEEKE